MTEYIRNSNCEAVQLDGEWMIMHAEKCTITKLNEVGGFCWSLLQTPHTLPALEAAVKDNYGIDHSGIGDELQAFLTDLLNCGLVEYAG